MFRQRTGLIISIILMLFLTVPVFAKDTNSTISNISIRVDQNLRTLEAGSSLGNISESDFTTTGDRYHVDAVQWVDSGNADTLKVGSEPKVLLYLAADSKDKNNGDTIYYQFFGAYTENNVRISNGSFVSAKRISSTELEIVIQLKAITGTYDTADNLNWSVNSLGRASWTAENNSSGFYEVKLFRDGNFITKVTTDALSLNFYPWMTEEGSYTFTVKTIPYTEAQKKAGKSSEEVESDVLNITASTRSNGEGKYSETQIFGQNKSGGNSGGNPSNTIGWSQYNGKWYFRYPNNQPAINTWIDWNGRWYHFNGQGEMETAWFRNAYGKWFYLDKVNGDAKIGWQLIDNVWYYFLPDSGDRQCMMLSNGIFQIGKESYYFDEKGAMRTGWVGLTINGKQVYYYFYNNGSMARNTTVDSFRINEQGQWVQ